MGKKFTSKKTTLGRAVINARENIPAVKRKRAAQLAKKGEIDVNKVAALDEEAIEKNMFSVTEQSSLDDFLAKAQLAGTDFTAERGNVSIVDASSNKLIGVMNKQDEEKIKAIHEKYKSLLTIPRRPVWNDTMSAEELQSLEVEKFLEWRRKIAQLQEVESLVVTPFERNIEIWRQLWRVLDRSDVVMQILDARNPLLFRSEDLESYVRELSADKLNVLLMNKADLLNDQQRKAWAQYFNELNVRVVFWSALEDKSNLSDVMEDIAISGFGSEPSLEDNAENLDESESDSEEKTSDVVEALESGRNELLDNAKNADESESEYSDDTTISDSQEESDSIVNEVVDVPRVEDLPAKSVVKSDVPTVVGLNSGDLLNQDQLIDYLKGLKDLVKNSKNDVFTIGLVGYPNVGKSSSINKLLGKKKVGVSATPGKTKHFQTLFFDDELMLCDCPGLVMPSFAMSKEQMIISAILSVDHMREFTAPISVICSQIPRAVFENMYGITLPKFDPDLTGGPPTSADNDSDVSRPPTSNELLTFYAFIRGFMSPKGIPDWSRAARVIVRDYVCGKLLYCVAPPGVDQKTFNDFEQFLSKKRNRNGVEELKIVEKRHLLDDDKMKPKDVDRNFFAGQAGSAHVKTSKKSVSVGKTAGDKPWRKHNNKNKKEKLRRIYGHLDV